MSAEKDAARVISETAESFLRRVIEEGSAILSRSEASLAAFETSPGSGEIASAQPRVRPSLPSSGIAESTRSDRDDYFRKLEQNEAAKRPAPAATPTPAEDELEKDAREATQPLRAAAREGETELEKCLLESRACLRDLEATHFELATRFFTALRIHSVSETPDLLDSLREVILNFTGVAEFVLFLHDDAQGRLFPLLCEPSTFACSNCWGRESAEYRHLTKLGRPWRVSDALVENGRDIGIIPMYAQDRLVGALRLVSFLPQKDQLSDSDKELLALVAHEGAIGLENTWNRALAKGQRWTQTDMEELLNA